MKHRQCNIRTSILILTGSVGSGHVSVARAVAEALHRINRGHFNVEIVDLITVLSNFATRAAKQIYLGSLKISPKIYELIFNQSNESQWPLKILNILSAPFMQQQFYELLQSKKPTVLVSTYPLWNTLIREVWEKYSVQAGKKLPFVNIVTDSITFHNAWAIGHPDFFLVANKDTKTSFMNFGIPKKKIRVFGYPVSKRFSSHAPCADFQQKMNLSPKRKTLLLILSTGVTWLKTRKLIKTIQISKLKNLQLVIIACGDKRWEKKLKAVVWPWPAQITGWTKEMHAFIHGSDIILTKAGGATVMECIASQRPMAIIEAIPGQEIGNAMMVQKYNLGVVLNKDLSDFDKAISYILDNEDLIKKNLAQQQKPSAADDTARFLMGLIEATKLRIGTNTTNGKILRTC